MLDVWIFGEVWCQGWLVVDVWMCTASILNLCAISVDRYLAVTRPVQYRSMMTGRRAKVVIFVVWLMSFLICFPPLVGWNGRTSFSQIRDSSSVDAEQQQPSITTPSTFESSRVSLNFSSLYVSSLHTSLRQQEQQFFDKTITAAEAATMSTDQVSPTTTSNCSPPTTSCTLFNDKGYVIYSALGSFWVPMLFMLFFYWRIYLVASRTTRALKRGYKSTKNRSSGGPGSPDERVTLRMHRGFAAPTEDSATTTTGVNVSSHTNSSSTSSPRFKLHEFMKRNPTIIETQFDEGSSSTQSQLEVSDGLRTTRSSSTRLNPVPSAKDKNRLSPSASIHSNLGATGGGAGSPCSSRAGSARSSAASARLARRTNTGKFQARRFHAETKAAKTVGIIVGGFIICWFPFFSAYLVRAFCQDDSCIPAILMSIFTWLGYCNSAINPVIYGLFSRDFRRAFKTIVCKCTFREDTGVSSLIRQIHLPTFLEDDTVRTTSHEEHHDHHLDFK